MNTRDRFVEKYEEGTTPWVHENVDFNLVDVVENWPIYPCSTVDLGCGTGVESIWLAKQGFDVTGIDGSAIAIDSAKKNIGDERVKCNFITSDFLTDNITEAPFDFVFDRGFFHSFDNLIDRKFVAEKIASILNEKGIWLTLMGNADAPPRDSGPPMRSAKDIIDAVEPYFKVLTLSVSFFGNDQENPAKIWVCLLRKR